MEQPGALDGIRVVELAGARTQYGAMLFAGLGAEVMLVEAPGGSAVRRQKPFLAGREGDLEASLPFHAHNFNKRGLVLDLSREDGVRAFRTLIADADIVIESHTPGALEKAGVGFSACAEINPRLIWTSITPYGATGPHAHYAGSDLSSQAMGGAMATTGEAGGRVFRAGGDVGDKMASYTAAAATLMALVERDRTGRGRFVDVSAQEAVAAQMETGTLFYTFTGQQPQRGGRLYPTAAFPCGLFPASDGWISLVALQPQHWQALVEWIGDPRLATERFKNGAERALARDEIDAVISAWSMQHSKQDLSREGQRRRIAVAAINTPREVAADAHLNEAKYFRTVTRDDLGSLTLPGPPFGASVTPYRVSSAAPRLGEHTTQVLAARPRSLAPETAPAAARDLPLAGLRVVDLSWVIAGPVCTRFLADHGAEVIKVEALGGGDPVRHFGPWLEGQNSAPEGGAAFVLLNRNKRSVTIDLKRPEGVKLLLDLARSSDVFVDNFAAGTMERLGLGYAALQGANPKIIMAQLSGFGQSGPYANRVAYGQTLLALTGHYDQIGEPDSSPLLPGYTYTDQAAGVIGAFAILAALHYRNRTGVGQHLDLSLFQIGSSLMAEFFAEALANGTESTRQGNGNDVAILHGVYRCKGDDRWCVIAVWTQRQWATLLDEISRDQPAIGSKLKQTDRRARDAAVEVWTSALAPEDVMRRLQARGIEAAMVQGPRELLADPHLAARGYFQSFAHVPSGKQLPSDGIPFHFDGVARAIRQGPPVLGEANDYVFRDLLGIGREDIERLQKLGVIGESKAA